MSFGKNLRSELLYNDIQIKEFAGKIDIPYSTLLSYIDKKERVPRVDIAIKIAHELGVTVEILSQESSSLNNNTKYMDECIEESIHKNLYNDIGLLPLEIQKKLLFLVKELLIFFDIENKE